jgi:hypothetical protein
MGTMIDPGARETGAVDQPVTGASSPDTPSSSGQILEPVEQIDDERGELVADDPAPAPWRLSPIYC